MALQMQKVLKSSMTQANIRCLSSGIFNSGLDKLSKTSPKTTNSNNVHLAVQFDYPEAKTLEMPSNIDSTEVARFSPLRSRDIAGSAIALQNQIDITSDNSMVYETPIADPQLHDAHIGLHDRSANVSLNAVMQSTVPDPFGGNKNFSHLNMPGGQWSQQTKYLSHELNSAHYTNLRQDMRQDWSVYEIKKGSFSMLQGYGNKLLLTDCISDHFLINKRFISLTTKNWNENSTKPEKPEDVAPLSRAEKLKKAVKEYGSTVIIFHVSISLVSLGISYLCVSSGLDVVAMVDKLGFSDKLTSKIAVGGSTFIVAYAVHKVFAPVRISITLGATPFIVRFLRQKGILKPLNK